MRVGPYMYSVEWDSSLSREGLYGEHEPMKRVIRLNPGSTVHEAEQTLIHELMHAAVDVSGISGFFGREGFSPTEEDIVRLVSPVMYQVLIDNPKIFQK